MVNHFRKRSASGTPKSTVPFENHGVDLLPAYAGLSSGVTTTEDVDIEECHLLLSSRWTWAT